MTEDYAITGAQQPYGEWHMEYVTLTGTIQGGLVECQAFGVSFFARPLFNTAFQSIPSQNWLAKYKNEFFGLVGYEKNIKERPVFLGLVPNNVSQEYQGDSITDKHKIRTQKYEIIIDDADEAILVGSPTATEPAALGNQLVDSLNTLGQILQEAKVITALGPQPFMPDTQAALVQWLDNLKNILSQVIKVI